MKNQKLEIKYILPNLFTAGSMFLAVLSIIASSNGDFEKAGWLIIFASIFDALDGRVARLTNTTSSFGMEFDSLADVISFGVAPALLYYFDIGKDLGKIGIFITGLYVIFGAVRLARFNVVKSEDEPNVFIGLPIPAAAIVVVSWIMIKDATFLSLRLSEVLVTAIMLIASILMVSNIRYPSFKKMNLEKRSFVRLLTLIIVVLGLIYIYPSIMILTLTTIYVILGPIRAFYMILFRKK